jgi:transposase
MAISWAFPPAHTAEFKAARVKKQDTDRQDAQLLLKLMGENRFPRFWVPIRRIAVGTHPVTNG